MDGVEGEFALPDVVTIFFSEGRSEITVVKLNSVFPSEPVSYSGGKGGTGEAQKNVGGDGDSPP